jgi:hypothetical protein
VILTQLEFNLLLGRTSPSSGLFPHVNSNNCGHTEVGSDLTIKKKAPAPNKMSLAMVDLRDEHSGNIRHR